MTSFDDFKAKYYRDLPSNVNAVMRPSTRAVFDGLLMLIHEQQESMERTLERLLKPRPIEATTPAMRNGDTTHPLPTRTPELFGAIKEMQRNADENSGGVMTPEDVAKLFGEAVPEVKKEELPTTKEGWEEREQELAWSQDIYKIAGRVKNQATMSCGGNLTSQGVALCNTFTHVLKSFYDFADTLYDANDREKMIALIRTHEGAAAAYIAAMRTGVKS